MRHVVTSFAICIALTCSTYTLAQTVPADDTLLGLWASEMRFLPALRGELTLTRNGTNWRASISGTEAQSSSSGNDINLVFPNGTGRFRGTLHSDGAEISGFWMQPASEGGDPNDPGGAAQSFASPLPLKHSGHNTWQGAVSPLPNSFTLYLSIFPGPQGLLAAFRNPEMNAIGGATQYRVARDGDMVRFTAGSDPAHPQIAHNATLAHAPDRLSILWPEIGRTIELRRRTPSEVPAYFPRPPGEPPYVYRKPPVTGDGWETTRARDVGMDEAPLTRLIQRLIETDPAGRRPSLIHSILVSYRGKLVLEEYFFGTDRNTPHDTRSAAKTFSSVMLGAAMMRDAPITPETRIFPLLASMGPFANPDPRKEQITLANLMTHTSGLACDDNDSNSPGEEGRMQTQTAEPNWWRYTLGLPMAHDPGSIYAYCSAGTNLVGGALTVATKTWLPAYFDRTIARPLHIAPYYWVISANGEGYLGGGVFMRPRDLLKVGQAYLDGGMWHGRRIVDAAWVTRSTAPSFHISPATTGLSPEDFSNAYNEADDAYAWHLAQLHTPTRTYRAYGASGNGGQLLVVVSDLQLVVVFTGGNYGQGGIWNKWRDQIIPQDIIPVIKS